ncbi:MAG TPA: hypothetical protein VG711_00555 [Phycisphaerales bacterium]|nr:hypothetical protein [Phycisphaerales bacterium]
MFRCPISYRVSLPLFVVLLGLISALSACESPPKAGSSNAASDQNDSLYLGQDWADQADAAAADQQANTNSSGLDPDTPSADASDSARTWGIVLQTFTGDDSQYAAANVKRQLPVVAPELANAQVKTTQVGSMLVWGAYTGPDDPHARQDLKNIKSLTSKNRPIFPHAMLAKVVDPNMTADPSTFNLMTARKKYPKVDPLYTLQVAIWTTDDMSANALKRIQNEANDYTRELRTKKFEAYVYHDTDKRMSTVTVGVFGANAIDAQSGLYSDEVEALLKKFPENLVNGLPLEEYKNPKHPELGTQVQKPKLVLVPSM